MPIFQTINLILDSKIVQWIIFSTLCVCLLLIVLLKMQNIALDAQIATLKENNANLGASLDVQSSLVKKQGDDMDKLKKSLHSASIEAEKMTQAYNNLKPLAGTCEGMVMETITSIKGAL